VLITGACGGIGQALCKGFSESGYQVIATDKEKTRELKCDYFIQCDLDDICIHDSALERFIDSVRGCVGASGLKVLINNAAIQILGSTDNISKQDWFKSINVNLSAPFLLTQAFLDELRQAKGSIINIASVHSRATKPGFTAYATSKAGLVGLTRSLAVDLGESIRVNALNPAATKTDMLVSGFEGKMDLYNKLEEMHPIKRIAEPSEIVDVALFLASEKASFLTGSVIDVDGGILSRLHDPD
jgi:NAD(P)-dependent dehydrogenase (short-subunit alcohol dehydrogenase family)